MASPAIQTDFPRAVHEIENTWIEMPDGTRLAARIWLPVDAGDDPVPAILEYLPYRKRDGTVERDLLTHPYFAGHGYAGVRVDMRGTGDSEGICQGEYLLQEQDDCLAVIDWLASQPWCSGKVGMIGISWGGFNGLQVAARQPDALGAVVSICSTDDRYSDDIHFMGGAILTDKLCWGAQALSIAMTPPDPEIVGDRWRALWLERLNGNGAWVFDWFRHQRRDAFWQHGSVCEDWSLVTTPVLAVGGWADPYTNTVFRLVENLPGPCKGIVGPWAHKYPHFAEPGPQIGFLQECLRWWDQHLKGIDTGVLDDPALRVWIQDSVIPAPHYSERPGRWVTEAGWTGAGHASRSFALSDGALVSEGRGSETAVSTPQTAGRDWPHFLTFGLIPDLNGDQREEAARAVILETEPLDAPLDVLGFPMLRGAVVSDKPNAMLAATLSVVLPDGSVNPVSVGVLNLTHRNGHETPEPLIPGAEAPFALQLNACGHRFEKGERLRLALSSTFWPMVFPSPEAVDLRLSAETRLDMPIFAGDGSPDVRFEPAEGAAPLERDVLTEGGYWRLHEVDQVSGANIYKRIHDTGSETHRHTGLTVRNVNTDTFFIQPDDPNSARVTCDWLKSYERGDWRAEVETATSCHATRDAWKLSVTLIARENGVEIFRKEWAEDVARDMV